MDLKGFIKKGTEELRDLSKEKMIEWLEEYKKAIAVLETFGFTVGKFTVGTTLLPEIHTSISGSIEDIRENELKTMIEDHQEDTLLVYLLKALILTKQFWKLVELKLMGVTIDLTLGVPPKINVEVH